MLSKDHNITHKNTEQRQMQSDRIKKMKYKPLEGNENWCHRNEMEINV